jgi:predicted RNA-binding protein with TRAM domain
MHALALALRPPVAVGDELGVHLVKAGKEPGQAVAYLDDGTMVVVENARPLVGEDVEVAITSVLMTANGRLVFARLPQQPEPQRAGRPRHAPSPAEHPTPGDLRPAAGGSGSVARGGER